MNKSLMIGIGVAIGVIIILLVVLIIVMATKNSGNDSDKKKVDATTAVEENEDITWEEDYSDESDGSESANISMKDIKIENTYILKNEDSYYEYVVVKNNGKTSADINAKGLAYNAKGKIVGTYEGAGVDIEPGATSIIYFYYDNPKSIARTKNNYEIEPCEYDQPAVNSVKCKLEKVSKEKVIVTTKNTSQKTLSDVEGVVLFFKGNKLVYSDSDYFGDSEDKLKKGQTENKEVDIYEDFDSAKIFITSAYIEE